MNKGNSDILVIPLYGRLFSFNEKRSDDIGKVLEKCFPGKVIFGLKSFPMRKNKAVLYLSDKRNFIRHLAK